jgi:hypothetical protein
MEKKKQQKYSLLYDDDDDVWLWSLRENKWISSCAFFPMREILSRWDGETDEQKPREREKFIRERVEPPYWHEDEEKKQ